MPIHVEFMSSSRSPYAKSGRSIQKKSGDPWLFWWTIAIFILIGITTFSWFASLYIFRHPEKPKNYKLLSKFKKLPTLTPFNQRDAPRGKFYDARQIYERYFSYTDAQLSAQNDLFKRNYIQNYDEGGPIYVKGTWRVYQARPLTQGDAITSGFVIRAESIDRPVVRLEMIFPASKVPSGHFDIEELVLNSNNYFASIVHVSRMPEETMLFTVIPLNYDDYKISERDGGILLSTKPPAQLNLSASWPVTDEARGQIEAADGVAK